MKKDKLPVPDLTYKEHDEAMIIKGMKTVNSDICIQTAHLTGYI